ncbi:MAG: hypothetical protein Hals2KO_02780 [Halioglobus sp.]
MHLAGEAAAIRYRQRSQYCRYLRRQPHAINGLRDALAYHVVLVTPGYISPKKH